MKVFIAEKPSMARELAKCLPGRMRREKGWIQCGDDAVTWAYGHILQQAEPQAYNPKYAYWRREDLPIIPDRWQLLVSPGSKEQFAVIKALIEKADSIVHAGDPDREGQLLIDEILEFVGNTKPVERILLNALDEKSIHEALRNLKNNKTFCHLKDSALARSRADWLIGMNLSRAYTLAARAQGHGKVTFPIGRVKTPTLALVVRRQRELENFTPVHYVILKAIFTHKNGPISAQWKPRDTQAGVDAEGRCLSAASVQAVMRKLQEQPHGVIEERKKTKKKEMPCLPLSLSALQVAAGKRYGYKPQEVLETAQQLYERKLTTYPRSDCAYLPRNQFGDRHKILADLQAWHGGSLGQWAANADASLCSRAWNDSKITAHHAIIPTTVRCRAETLTPIQQRIYYLIAQAYVAQFYPPHEYEQTRLVIRCAEELFVAHGKTVTVPGWKILYESEKKADESEKQPLPQVRKGDNVVYTDGRMEEKATKPPARFTAAGLLAAMKEIYKYVKDESLKKTLKDVQGIGTEATRATIIKELMERKFLLEEGKKGYLVPGPQAYVLIDSLPEALSYPDETAIWEERLHQISLGKEKLATFLADQIAFLQRLLASAGVGTASAARKCPVCGAVLRLRHGKFGAFYGCSAYPSCRYTTTAAASSAASRPDRNTEYICPQCQGTLQRKNGPYGIFWACNQPSCRFTVKDIHGVPGIYEERRPADAKR